MSWIKKVLSFLQQGEQEGSEYEALPKKTNQSLHTKKEIDTKMVYHYPKGSFRFPLIPDERNERNERNERPKTERKDKESKEGKQRTPDNTSYKDSYQIEYEETRRNQKEGSKQPFKPTEIPSAIYGFRNRPVKKEEPEIEYELSTTPKKEPLSNVVKLAKEPFAETKDLVNQEIKRDEAAKNEEDSIQAEESIVHLNEWTKKDESVAEQDVKNEKSNTAEETPSLEETLDTKQEAETAEAERQNKQELDLIEEPVLQAEEEFFTQESDQEMVQEPEDITGTIETKETEEKTETEQKTDAAADLQYEEPVDGDSKQEPLEPARSETIESGQPVKKEKRGGQLPFNVMMLKQDRRKMSDKAQTNRPIGSSKPVSRQEENQPSSEKTAETIQEPVSIPNATLETKDDDLAYYAFPSMNLLMPPVHAEVDQDWLDEQAQLLDETLFSFNVNAKVKHVTQGPSVTRFELFPEKGVKVSKITSLTDDIKLSLAARDIRMEAPIPGKMAIGIEIPNPTSRPVALKEILDHKAFKESSATLPIALGLDIEGQPVVTDIGKMPHGLIAGATGSGKSVCINSILVSLLYHSSPDDLRLLLIDPKMVELAPYNHIPHLVSPVITDVKAATAALKWAVEEMERRYQLFAHAGVRDIGRYNQKAKEARQFNQKLPYLVIVIDELADLMMMSPADVEEAICRIAQKARACGIHLLIATQRPSVDVITGLIKANVPTRVAFSVSSQVDSRTIIDTSGADRLLGRGDMLFLGNGASKPVRLQGTFVSDDEIDSVVAHVRKEREVSYLFHQEELLAKVEIQDEEDELLMDACELVVTQGGASTSLLQRQFRIGYNRAARLIDLMEKQGWISEAKGSKPRDVLMTNEDLQSLQDTGTSQ